MHTLQPFNFKNRTAATSRTLTKKFLNLLGSVAAMLENYTKFNRVCRNLVDWFLICGPKLPFELLDECCTAARQAGHSLLKQASFGERMVAARTKGEFAFSPPALGCSSCDCVSRSFESCPPNHSAGNTFAQTARSHFVRLATGRSDARITHSHAHPAGLGRAGAPLRPHKIGLP